MRQENEESRVCIAWKGLHTEQQSQPWWMQITVYSLSNE